MLRAFAERVFGAPREDEPNAPTGFMRRFAPILGRRRAKDEASDVAAAPAGRSLADCPLCGAACVEWQWSAPQNDRFACRCARKRSLEFGKAMAARMAGSGTEKAGSRRSIKDMRSDWIEAGADAATAERLVALGIRDKDGIQKAIDRATQACDRAKAAIGSANRPDMPVMIDAVDLGEAMLHPCGCGRCGGMAREISRIPDIQTDGWPYKPTINAALTVMDVLRNADAKNGAEPNEEESHGERRHAARA